LDYTKWIGSVGEAKKLIQCNPLFRGAKHTKPHKYRGGGGRLCRRDGSRGHRKDLEPDPQANIY